MVFRIFKDKKGQFRFSFIASNGKTVCQSEAYTRRINCLGGIKSVKGCNKAKIVDKTR